MFYFIELFRRIILVASLIVASWFMFFPEGTLLVLKEVNFESDYKNPSAYFRSSKSFLDFKEAKLKDRKFEVSTQVWTRISEQLGENTLFSDARKDGRWVLQPTSLSDYSFDWPNFVYLQKVNTEEYISISRVHSSEIYGLDSSLKYPMRGYVPYLLIFALFTYIILPRKKIKKELIYKRMASVILPDLLGSIMASFFFSLSILIVMENNPADSLWEASQGWEAVIVLMWGMSSLFLLMLLIGQKYANLSIELSDKFLIVNKGISPCYYAWEDMECYTDYEGKRGRFLGLLLIFFARGPGHVGQGLLVANNEEYGIEIHNKKQRKLKIMANHLPAFKEIIEALEKRNIPSS